MSYFYPHYSKLMRYIEIFSTTLYTHLVGDFSTVASYAIVPAPNKGYLMGKGTDDFFEGKRPWSKIKDQVLQKYMIPYLAKVNTLRQPILLIDGYAGPGVFDDGTYGSPIIMCEKAEERVNDNYHAFFINNKKKYHEALSTEITNRRWSSSVTTLLGDTKLLLPTIHKDLKEQSVFLYLDPFGPTGCDFSLLQLFLERDSRFSTEVILTLSMPGMHRLATSQAVKKGRNDEQIAGFHRQLTRIFGGDYWQSILWQEIDAEQRETQLVEAYCDILRQYLPFAGFCPVREQIDKRIKYFIVFVSRSKDAMLLLNDIMVNAYFGGMHEAKFGTGLFKDFDWRDTETRYIGGLSQIILDTVTNHPGETRKFTWFRIVQKHFMHYLESEYIRTVQQLVDSHALTSPTPRKTKRLNEDCVLFPTTRLL